MGEVRPTALYRAPGCISGSSIIMHEYIDFTGITSMNILQCQHFLGKAFEMIKKLVVRSVYVYQLWQIETGWGYEIVL